MFLTTISLSYFSIVSLAQQRRAVKEPFQITDSSTGKPIQEVLVMPLYSSVSGVFIAPEGPSKSSVSYYLKNPFVYRAGEKFLPKKPPVFTGLPLFPVLIGKGRETEGVLFVASGYHPYWYNDLWWYPKNSDDKRKIALTPISDDDWMKLSKNQLNFLFNDDSYTNKSCQMWNLSEPCKIEVNYAKKERETVRAFLER